MTTTTTEDVPTPRRRTITRRKPGTALVPKPDVEEGVLEKPVEAAPPAPTPPAPAPAPRPSPVVFSASDDDDDDEDEDDGVQEGDLEEEDDEDDGPAKPVSMPPRRFALGGVAPSVGGAPSSPPIPGGPRVLGDPLAAANAEVRNRKVQQLLAAEDDLAELSEGLEFGNNQHEIKLTRTRSNPPGVSKGFLDSFYRRITVGEIKDLYGGGEFLYTIWGPGPDGKRYCKSKKTITIEGASLVNGVPAGMQPDAGTSNAKDMIKVVLDAKEREAQRLVDEIKELKRAQMEFLARDPAASVMAMMKEANERQAQLQREAMERDEKRRAEEREERRAEEQRRLVEEQRRRAEEKERADAEKAKATMDMQLMLQMMQNNTQVLIASMKDAASSKEAGFATILAAVQQSSQQQMSTVQQNFAQQIQMVQQQHQNTVQQMAAFAEQREKLAMDALKEARSGSKDLTTQLMDIAKVKNSMDVVFGGGAAAQASGVVETIKEIAASPAAPALIQAFLGRGGQVAMPPAPPPGTPPGMQAPPVALGSVQVSGPAPKGPSPWPTTSGAPALPRVKAKAKMPVIPPPAMAVPPVAGQPPVSVAPPAPASPPSEPAPAVESLGIPFPPEDASSEVKFEALIRLLDAAMKAEWSTRSMFDQIVVKFPGDVAKTLKETEFEKVLQIIELMAPSSVLATAQGTQVMRDLFDMLTAG